MVPASEQFLSVRSNPCDTRRRQFVEKQNEKVGQHSERYVKCILQGQVSVAMLLDDATRAKQKMWAKWRKLVSEQVRSCHRRRFAANAGCVPHFFAWKKRLGQAATPRQP